MEDEVILELRDNGGDGEGDCVVLEAAAMDREDWIMPLVARRCRVLLHASRSRLSEKSSYFRSLFANFREAQSDRVVVTWNLEVLARILQGIFSQRLEIDPSKIADLLEGATFFGCDCIIAECETWVANMLSCSDIKSTWDVLQYVPRLWKVATETGVPTIARACARYLAINFEDVASGEILEDIPASLFKAAVAHPSLTVSSEKELLGAMCRRFETRELAADLLNEVRLSWLPLDFLSDHLDILMPSLLSSGSRGLVLEPSGMESVGLRLSQYTKTLDLTGCQQVTGATLFDSVLCSSIKIEGAYILHTLLNNSSRYSNSSPAGPFLNQAVSLYPLPEDRTRFEKVQFPSDCEVDRADRSGVPILSSLKVLLLGKCWRVRPEELLLWIKTACSGLQQLNLSRCPQFSAVSLSHLASACPLVEIADLSRDVSVIHHASTTKLCTEKLLTSSYKQGSWGSLRYLTELSLVGHTELKDSDFSLISKKCASISAISVSGCSNLSDSAIAKFLQCHLRIKVLRVASTAFGFQSLCALLATSEKDCTLEILDVGHCKGLSAGALVRLLTRISSFISLSVCYTSLINDGLYLFSGTYLKSLNIRGTQVSGAAIAYVLRRNRNITHLNFRDCRGAFAYEDLIKGDLQLLELKAGWGFSHILGNVRLPDLQTLTLGLGAEVTSSFLYDLPSLSPHLAHLSLCLQDLSDDSLEYALANLSQLTTLKLRHTLQPISEKFLTSLPANLVTLVLEDACPSLANSHLSLMATSCKCLRQLSLTGCHHLDSGAVSIISDGWPGLRNLKLEDCGEVTKEGASPLLVLFGLEILVLRHNGSGLPKNFIIDALSQLPLLRCLSLDSCDTVGQFWTPQDGNWGSLFTIKIAYCRSVSSAFSLDGKGQRAHRHTEVMERGGSMLHTYIVKERL